MEENSKIKMITPADADFPYLLKEMNSIIKPSLASKRLFVEGTLPDCSKESKTKFLSVVGARRHSSYGREACERVIAGLAGYNICIVSGLALGIDNIAHEAALAAGLMTIAFPGSGLSRHVLYPPRNQRTARRIIEAGGALVSEFDMDFHATEWSFPQRNRLMAGISHATLVIEAKLESGTLITSSLADQYNRDVFAVPGPIFSALSDGPNMLISKGAAIIRSSQDILDGFGIAVHDEHSGKIAKKNYSDEEKIVLDILIEPMQKDRLIRDIISSSGKNISEINALLIMMELADLIVEESGMIRMR